MAKARLNFIRTYPVVWVLLVIGLLTLVILLWDQVIPAITYAASSLWQMAPIAVAGMLVTALLTATGAISLLVRTFGARELAAVVLVSIIGSVLPVCGITLLPLVAGLLGAGVALAPVMAFLLSSAVTDPQMFAITASTLGLSFAVGKTVAALGIGVLGGLVTWVMVRAGWLHQPARESSMLGSFVPESACAGPDQVLWRFWTDSECLALFKETCVSMAKLVVLLMSVAFVGEYFLKLYLPHDALSQFVDGDNPFAIPIAALVGAPLYLDGYAALPLVRGLIERGMAVGPAMAFLIAGGITSAWTAFLVFALVRLPVFVAYVVMAIVGSALAGWAYALIV